MNAYTDPNRIYSRDDTDEEFRKAIADELETEIVRLTDWDIEAVSKIAGDTYRFPGLDNSFDLKCGLARVKAAREIMQDGTTEMETKACALIEEMHEALHGERNQPLRVKAMQMRDMLRSGR